VDLQPESESTEGSKRVKVKILEIRFSERAEAVYNHLVERAPHSKTERSILNAIKRNFELIKSDPERGDKIKIRRFPAAYVDYYGITNLYKLELSNFWRMFYTVVWSDAERRFFIHIIDIIDHREYDRKFKGRGR